MVDYGRVAMWPNFNMHCVKISFPCEAVKQAKVRRLGFSFNGRRLRPKSNHLGSVKSYRMKRAVKIPTQFCNCTENSVFPSFCPTLTGNFSFFVKGIYMLVYKNAKIVVENTCDFIYEFRSCNIKPAQWIYDLLKPWKSCKIHSSLSMWLIISMISFR